MTDILNDQLNVELMKLVCAGKGVEINISELSEHFRKHRNTVTSKIELIFEHRIADKPFHPFPLLLERYPFFVIEKCRFPRNKKTNEWIEVDPYIWAAFFFRDEEYNTLLFELHKDLYHYQMWKDRIIDEGQIALDQGCDYVPSEAIYFHSKAIIKYDPSAVFKIFKTNQQEGIHGKINGLEIDNTTLNLLEALLYGRGVWTNSNYLANQLGVNRRTVQRRLNILLERRIISQATSRFPRIWVPPRYFMVMSLLEIRAHKDRISTILSADPHVSFLAKTKAGRYNYMSIGGFYRMRDHLAWEEEYGERFSGSIGAVKNYYLSPAMTFSIHQQYVALEYLDQLSKQLRGKQLLKSMRIRD